MLAGRRSFPLNRDFGQSGDELVRAERAIFCRIFVFFGPKSPKIFSFLSASQRGNAPFLSTCGAKRKADFLMRRFLNAHQQLYEIKHGLPR